MREPHRTTPVLAWVDVDEGIASMVIYLNTIPGVRTLTSCQGTIGEGGPRPYRPYVLAIWPNEADDRLRGEFDTTFIVRRTEHSEGRLHPRPGWRAPWAGRPVSRLISAARSRISTGCSG